WRAAQEVRRAEGREEFRAGRPDSSAPAHPARRAEGADHLLDYEPSDPDRTDPRRAEHRPGDLYRWAVHIVRLVQDPQRDRAARTAQRPEHAGRCGETARPGAGADDPR